MSNSTSSSDSVRLTHPMIFHSQGCQDTERSPNLTINHLPDEVLLEIFDSYRRLEDIGPCIGPHNHQWKKNYVWFNLAHVCRRWRAVTFASSSRLDLAITVGPEKPSNFKEILSSPLPILVDYAYMREDITGSALWRLRAALEHHRDRVREIAFGGSRASFDKFFQVTNCAFPILESVFLQFGRCNESNIPDTFLRGSDLSELQLRRLRLYNVTLASISGFLLSATALTDLHLLIDTAFGPSPKTSLLACFQGMPCLRSLRVDVSIAFGREFLSQPPTPKDIVPLSKLTFFRYRGHSIFLDALVAGISAASLRDVEIEFFVIQPLVVHLPRFINEIEAHYHAVHVTFRDFDIRLSFLTQSEYIGHCVLYIILGPSLDSVMQMSAALSTKLAAVEELRVTVYKTEFFLSWRGFYHQCHSVKVLRTGGIHNDFIARTLFQDHQDHGEPDDLAFLPALEEIDLGEKLKPFYESERRSQLAAFQPFVSARQRAGRPVKVFFRP